MTLIQFESVPYLKTNTIFNYDQWPYKRAERGNYR